MKRWRFISNHNSLIVGINDAGIETFTADMNRALIREMLQNSLDAGLPEGDGTVKVDFVCFDMPRNLVPGIESLQDSMRKCMNSSVGEPDALKFFQEAQKLLEQSVIKVLRISDHNTVGLEGSDSCKKGTNWSRLVKESGSSNKEQSSGGSFGIGKSAAFACSDLRTVFYSSIDRNGLKSNFGVARLVSFQDERIGGWTTGIGYYSEDERFVAIPELADYDKNYKRTDSGTDVYIMGMHIDDDFVKTFIQFVLLEFLVSIVQGKLAVNIQGEMIDKNSLVKYMSDLNPYESEEIKNLQAYHHILTSSDPTIKKIALDSTVYGAKYGFKDKECMLYLKEGEGLNRRILMTRKAGMRIQEQDRISGSIEFTGVLIIDGAAMNEAFKKMEVPSHDAWEPGRCRGEEKYYNDILINLKRYLKKMVKVCYGKETSDTMDAIGASDFLPDRVVDGMDKKLLRSEFNTRIKEVKEKSVRPTRQRTTVFDVAMVSSEEYGDGSGGYQNGDGNLSRTEPHPGPGAGMNSGIKGSKAGKSTSYKEISLKKRLICSDVKNGIYILSFVVPLTSGRGKLVFVLTGEQSDFKLPIERAHIISETHNAVIEECTENTVYLKNLIKGERLRIEVQVEFDTYCTMEVDYYADKR